MSEQKPVSKVSFPHRLVAGLGMVLLAVIWVAGWLARSDIYTDTESPMLFLVLTATVLAAWTLLTAVIAAGFFHAANKHPANTFRAYRNASLRLLVGGVLILFPGPLMALVLGSTAEGRALALVVTAISISAILFGRARIHLIEARLSELAAMDDETVSLAPWETTEKRSSPTKNAS